MTTFMTTLRVRMVVAVSLTGLVLLTTAGLVPASAEPVAAPRSTELDSTGPGESWPEQRYDAAQTGYDPYEATLGPGNVGHLVTLATAQLGESFSAAPPVVADGMVFVSSYYSTGGQPGEVEAFPETCTAHRKRSCVPTWKAMVGYDDSMGVTVADGDVLVNTLTIEAHQELWVFSAHCGQNGAFCSPLWTTIFSGRSYSNSAPTVADGTIYVPYGRVFHSDLEAFPLACSTGCRPTWIGRLGVEGDGSAAVGDGFVYEADYDGNVDAFRVGCASSGSMCAMAWYGSVGEAGPRTPSVADGLVFIGSQNGDLFAFKASGCGSSNSDCSPVWQDITKSGANILSTPAVGDGLVFVTDYADGYLYAFPEQCGSSCRPTWIAFVGRENTSSPVVANRVVYDGGSGGRRRVGIFAFSTSCAFGGGTCKPLWYGNGGSYYIPSGPSIAGGEVLATGGPQSGPAELLVFGLPRSPGR